MGFLRRLLGGPPPDAAAEIPADAAADDSPLDEEARERELIRADAERLSDDLIQRQLRYADRSWTPTAQGGTRRSDDTEAEAAER